MCTAAKILNPASMLPGGDNKFINPASMITNSSNRVINPLGSLVGNPQANKPSSILTAPATTPSASTGTVLGT